MSAGVPPQVSELPRLQAVERVELIGEEPAPGIRRLVQLAATLMRTPMAFFTVVDEQRSWYHAAVGVPDDVDSGPVEASFCKYVIASGEPLFVPDAATDARTVGNPAIATMGVAAWAGFPVRDPDGNVLGSFCVVDTEPHAWLDRDVELLGILAAAANDEIDHHLTRGREATARGLVDTSRAIVDDLLRRQRDLLELMQYSLLPTAVPTVDGLEIAVRYQAASTTSALGGDWYDVMDLGGGSSALVVADVSGHDAQSVATMAQLRPSLHALAQDDGRPASVLSRLHALMTETGVERFLTAFYGLWDATSSTLAFQCAGHPPPILIPQGERPRLCEAGRSGLVGAFDAPEANEHRMVLDVGDTLVVYTDGLVERRDRSIDDTLETLIETLGERRWPSVEAMADSIMEQARPDAGWEDDVALLIARCQPG